MSLRESQKNELVVLASKAAEKVLSNSFNLNRKSNVLIYTNHKLPEEYSELAEIMTKGYMLATANLDLNMEPFFTESKSALDIVGDKEVNVIKTMSPGDAVIFALNLKQGSFKSNGDMGKLESEHLRENKVHYAQHFRLGGIKTFEDMKTYITALTVDYSSMQSTGMKIKNELANANRVIVKSIDGSELVYEGGFHEANVFCGNFDGTNAYGGNFPSGETFTEPKKLKLVNGSAIIKAYATLDSAEIPEKGFKIKIENGNLVSSESDGLFEVLEKQKKQNPDLPELYFNGYPAREMGFGVNTSISELLKNVTWIEKSPGYHFSLGPSHSFYKSTNNWIDNLSRKKGVVSKGHIDLVTALDTIYIDDKVVFEGGKYIL